MCEESEPRIRVRPRMVQVIRPVVQVVRAKPRPIRDEGGRSTLSAERVVQDAAGYLVAYDD